MSKKNKKNNVNEKVLSSISGPNAWTKELEEEWNKQPASAIERRFPERGPGSIGKPRHVKYVCTKKE